MTIQRRTEFTVGPVLGREARRADRVADEDEDREREEEERVHGDARAPLGEQVLAEDGESGPEEGRGRAGVHNDTVSSAIARSRRSFEATIAIPRARCSATIFCDDGTARLVEVRAGLVEEKDTRGRGASRRRASRSAAGPWREKREISSSGIRAGGRRPRAARARGRARPAGRGHLRRTSGSPRRSAHRTARGRAPPTRCTRERRAARGRPQPSSPSKKIFADPPLGRIRPARVLSRVVFPLPFCPAIPRTRPFSTANVRGPMIFRVPKERVRPSATRRMRAEG